MMESSIKGQEASNNIQQSHLDRSRKESSNFYLLSDNPGAMLSTSIFVLYYLGSLYYSNKLEIETLRLLKNITLSYSKK